MEGLLQTYGEGTVLLWVGALVGVVFGVDMILVRGRASRLLVLSATGNLRCNSGV